MYLETAEDAWVLLFVAELMRLSPKESQPLSAILARDLHQSMSHLSGDQAAQLAFMEITVPTETRHWSQIQRDQVLIYRAEYGQNRHNSDSKSLLSLFSGAEVSAVAHPLDQAKAIREVMLAHPGVRVFDAENSGQIAETCMLIIAPNLLRIGKRHGFLENVVAHPEPRGQSQGKAAVRATLEHAWSQDCYHVLLQSGRLDSRIHTFHEGLGFRPGLRLAYVVSRPMKGRPL